MAVERVERLLADVTGALEAAAIPYAVVGGNAVAAWVATVDEAAVRATKDVDILIRRKDLPATSATLQALDMMPVEVLGVVMFVPRANPNPKSGVHIVFAGERIRAAYVHDAPDAEQAVRAVAGFRVVELVELVKMKLQSNRPIDQAHVIDMIGVGLITNEVEAALPADLRVRLTAIRELGA